MWRSIFLIVCDVMKLVTCVHDSNVMNAQYSHLCFILQNEIRSFCDKCTFYAMCFGQATHLFMGSDHALFSWKISL